MDGTLNIPDLIVAGLIALGIFQGLAVSLLFFFRVTGNKKSNRFFAYLLLVFSIALTNSLLLHLGIFHNNPSLQYIPLWYTLIFGPFLFYYVKFLLYPNYELRWSDSKHFLLPLVQGIFYWYVWFQSVDYKLWITEFVVFPFYKTLEGVLFVLSFFSYLALSYRYVKYKEATLKKRGFDWERLKIRWLKRVLRVLFLLAGLNTFYIVADFIAYQFFNLDLFGIKAYAYLTDLSFAAMLYWLAYSGLKNEFSNWYGTEELSNKSITDLLEQQMTVEKVYRDPDLKLDRLAKTLNIEGYLLEKHLQDHLKMDFQEFIDHSRVQEIKGRMRNPHYRRYTTTSLGYAAGFTSKKHFEKAFFKDTGMMPHSYRTQAPS